MTKEFATHVCMMVACPICNVQDGHPCVTDYGNERRQPHDVRIRRHRRTCVPCIYREVNP